MKKLVSVKNILLVILLVVLSLKLWTKISGIANGVKGKESNTPYGLVGLSKDSPPIDLKMKEAKTLDKSPMSVYSSSFSIRGNEDPKSKGNTGVRETKSSAMITSKQLQDRVLSTKPELAPTKSNEYFNKKSEEGYETIDEKDKDSLVHASPRDTISPIQTKTFNATVLGTGVLNSSELKLTTTHSTLIEENTTGSNRTETHHVAFLKVHKCGSSTVQNIFLRFGYLRNLTFVLPHDNQEKSESTYVNVISYKRSLTDDNVVPPPQGRHFEILCCHVIYNRDQFQNFLPKNVINIGIVREPIKRLESSIGYFRLLKDVKLSEFASNPLKYIKQFPSMLNNRMAFEFGFPSECFPSIASNSSFESISNTIKSHLASLSDDFKFIIITEHMDESLVYMRRMLHWQLKDILYVTLLNAQVPRRHFSEEEALKLKTFLYLDFALYDFALKLFEEAIAKETGDFQREVEHFQETNKKVGEFCKTKSMETLWIESSKWNPKFSITPEDCRLLTLFEITFVQRIRQQQYGRVNN